MTFDRDLEIPGGTPAGAVPGASGAGAKPAPNPQGTMTSRCPYFSVSHQPEQEFKIS